MQCGGVVVGLLVVEVWLGFFVVVLDGVFELVQHVDGFVELFVVD